mgnify:CR=1 FL=1
MYENGVSGENLEGSRIKKQGGLADRGVCAESPGGETSVQPKSTRERGGRM